MLSFPKIETFAEKVYKRWRKRIFPNDNIVIRDVDNGIQELIVTRGNYEAKIQIDKNHSFTSNDFLVVDSEMRYLMGKIKKRLITSCVLQESPEQSE